MRRVIFTYCVLTVCFYRNRLVLFPFYLARGLDGVFIVAGGIYLGMNLSSHVNHEDGNIARINPGDSAGLTQSFRSDLLQF